MSFEEIEQFSQEEKLRNMREIHMRFNRGE